MTQEQMIQVVMNRATEMLKDAKINSIYQSFKNRRRGKRLDYKISISNFNNTSK